MDKPTDANPTAPMSDPKAILDAMAPLEESDITLSKPDEGKATETKTAPVKENPEDPASVEGEPAEGTPKTEGESEQTPAEGEPLKKEAKTLTPEEQAEQEQMEARERELLGVPAEAETVPVLKKRYSDACSHITHLESSLNEVKAFMEQQGLEVIKTKDGLAFAPTEAYKQKPIKEIIDTSKIYRDLSDADKAMFEDNPEQACEKIASKIAQEMLVKNPPVSASRQDRVLDNEEISRIYEEFADEKLSDKSSKYPDALDVVVKQKMAEAFYAPNKGMEKLRNLAMRDPQLHKIAMEFCWLKAYRAFAEVNAFKAAKERERQKKITENKSGPAVNAKGANMPARGQKGAQTMKDVSDQKLDEIVDSDKSTRSTW